MAAPSSISTPAVKPLSFLDDLFVGETRHLGSTVLAPDAVRAFAETFDPLPFHVDEAAARETIFGGVIASGLHTLSAVHALAVRSGFLASAVIVGASGIDHMRFRKPVRPGDTLTVNIEITKVRPPREGAGFGTACIAYTVQNQDGAEVLTFVDNQLVRLRPQPGEEAVVRP